MGLCECADPTHSPELRRVSWLIFDAAFGAGWPTCTPGAARTLVVSLASTAEWLENNRCVSAPHDDMHRRRRESREWRGLLSVAAGWSDRARTVALRPLPRWCGCVFKPWYIPGWLWPLRMAERVSKRATRGAERQSTEAPGHRIRAPRPGRSVRSVFTRRACFPGACGLGGSSAR